MHPAKSNINILLITLSFGLSLGDVYMHNPRGSNNRLNEKTAARTNADRLFDSQNNNRGGYNVGDATSAPATTETLQYQMKYFQSGPVADTHLEIEWTMQHGCGMNIDPQIEQPEINCNVILQYLCQDTVENQNSIQRMRDGTTITAQDFTATAAINPETYFDDAARRATANIKADRGFHETWSNYEACHIRERNQGLFTADVTLAKTLGYSSAIHTRQNAAGTRRGYECPEERDYHPYWHPNPWKDIAVIVSDSTTCSNVQRTSFNVQPLHECVEKDSKNRRISSKWNNEDSCKANGGEWFPFYNYLEKATAFSTQETCEWKTPVKHHRYLWAVPYDSSTLLPECLVALNEPECLQGPWNRANHLGNTDAGRTPLYRWTVPYFPSETSQTCVLRVRYNISSYDYDSSTDYQYNQNKEANVKSPVTNNPVINLHNNKAALQMTINTAQLGRTFQDRSHVFKLLPRPETLKYQTINNLNVRGKRGNIVQTYPATEYDFTPTTVNMEDGDLLHIQWTGSNTHNNDGAGSDGVGTAGTDRNNIVEIRNLGTNHLIPFEDTRLWKNSEIKWISFEKENLSALGLAFNLASSGFYRCVNATECPEPKHQNYIVETKAEVMNNVLNNAPASYEGVVIQIRKGTYYIMCTRNNNYSNRSQKGTIIVQ